MNVNPIPPARGTIPFGELSGVFAAVFLLVLIASVLVTYLMPEAFQGVARIKVVPVGKAPDAEVNDLSFLMTEAETIRSEVVLAKVVQVLDLNSRWGKRYNNGLRLTVADSVNLLQRNLDVRPVRNTALLEIRVYGDSPSQCAEIANYITVAYREHAMSAAVPVRVEVLDPAQPAARPVRPNKPLNIAIGAVVGLVLGAGASAFVLWLRLQAERRRSASPPSVPL